MCALVTGVQTCALPICPILPQKFQKKPAGDKTTQLNIVTRLIKQAREIVIATDAGREGEAIAWYILDYAGWRGPCLRFWTSSLNESHLRKAGQIGRAHV